MTGVPELLEAHPWLREPELEVCAVGSTALFEACRRAELPLPPEPKDVDLSWALTPEAGRALLEEKGFRVQSTDGALGRGTLGATRDGQRLEITSFRGGGDTPNRRIGEDAARRDMTIGALYWSFARNRIHDPLQGLDDWRKARIRACGDAGERIREHPIRALRYFRRAVELGFWIDSATRRAVRETAAEVAAGVVPEALAEELRRVLAKCTSPGAFFQMCHEEKLLAHLLPEIAPQFDGRPAGRIRWHAEVSQGLHMILALRGAARLAERDSLPETDRVRLLLCVLCHDLGKGRTPEDEMPSHPGHEAAGVPVIEELFERLPALGSKPTQRLCKVAARHHQTLERLRKLKPGTLVDLWERDLAKIRDDHATLVRVVRCDREGRLRPEELGLPRPPQDEPPVDYDAYEERVRSDVAELDAVLSAVSGEESARLHSGDPAALREHLRDARCRALRDSGFLRR